MVTIDCLDPTLRLRLPDCASAITAAALISGCRPDYLLTATIDPDDHSAISLGGLPEDVRRGVYELKLETDCGCFASPVFVDVCRAPQHEAVHTATMTYGGSTECCAPTLQPDLSVLPATIALSVESTTISAPDLNITTVVRTDSVLTLSIAPVPSQPTSAVLIDGNGITVATGAVLNASGVATVSFALSAPLRCTDYYLTLA